MRLNIRLLVRPETGLLLCGKPNQIIGRFLEKLALDNPNELRLDFEECLDTLDLSPVKTDLQHSQLSCHTASILPVALSKITTKPPVSCKLHTRLTSCRL